MLGGCFLVSCLLLPVLSRAAETEQARAAAGRSIRLLQKVAAEWKGGCFSCHHQGLPMMALAEARLHGLAVDEGAAQAANSKTFEKLVDLDNIVQGRSIIDPSFSDGYFLLAAHAVGVEPSLSTAALARRIASFQRGNGHWPTLDGRPPHSASLIAATAIAARAVSLYLPTQLESQKRTALEKARTWLLSAKPVSTEDRAFQLLGAAWTGASEAERRRAAAGLLAAQQSDGGWAGMPGIESDAYSTSQSLYALSTAAGLAVSDERFQRGIAWLLRTQKPDGSWQVKSWIDTPAPVSPPYMETGFPYGHDQFLSCAATSWAVMALSAALPPASAPVKPAPVLSARPQGVPDWAETALFGSAEELKRVLERPLDPNSTTAAGTSLLMMSANDAAKVQLLLDRGAKADAKAKSGYEALMTASLFLGNAPSVGLLLQRGVSPKPRTGILLNASALAHASFTGDADVAALLLQNGASVQRKMNVLGFFQASPLFIATGFGYSDLVRLLIRHGGKVDETDNDKMTLLSWSALNHKNEMVKLLLELGANPNHVDKFGYTPLRHASGIRYDSPQTAEMLKTVTKVRASR